jgi:hypothetical protein
MDIGKSTISNTVNEFANCYMLTENEKDFPRKLLSLYTAELDEGVTPLDINDIKLLRRHVERIRRRDISEDEIEDLPGMGQQDNAYEHHSQTINNMSMPQQLAKACICLQGRKCVQLHISI